jgi:cytidylate kinase
MRTGIAGHDADRLTALARDLDIRIRPPSVNDGRQVDVLLEGEDVTWEIRTPRIDSAVSEVSAHPPVRQELLDIQRRIADGTRVVMVGRDIGTVVIPHAGTKIFLVASTRERARRRVEELRNRGVDADDEQVLADLRARDAYDSSRETAPLAAADDAIVVDTDGRSIDEIVDQVERIARAAWQAAGVSA